MRQKPPSLWFSPDWLDLFFEAPCIRPFIWSWKYGIEIYFTGLYVEVLPNLHLDVKLLVQYIKIYENKTYGKLIGLYNF